MPPQVTKSGLFAKYGKNINSAISKNKDNPIDLGFQRVPPGINNGIAQLVECKFDAVEAGKQNAGEYYFRAAGVVVEPNSIVHNGSVVPVAGMQTSIMEMVCDTKNVEGKVTSQEEHVANIINEMKKLGAEFSANADASELEAIAAALKEAKPYFRFSTSESKPQIDPKTKKPKINPRTGKEYDARTWENWYGVQGLENYQPPEGGGVNDNSGVPTPSDNGDGTVEYSDSMDLSTLLGHANGTGDQAEKAQDRLKELAMAKGHPEEVCDATGSWQELADLAGTEPEGTEGETEAPADEPWVPKKGEVYFHKPTDKKTGKPVKKGVECEITLVNPKNKTVDVKRLDTKAAIKGVKWDDLAGE